MLAKRIIACLDVKDGRTVKGVRFLDLRDAGDPCELAQKYSEAGVDELVYLDISATLEGRVALMDLVERTAKQVAIPLTVGGGIRSADEAVQLVAAGADKITLNSAALARPQLIAECAQALGSQAIVVAIDAKRTELGFEVFTRAGTVATGILAEDWACTCEQMGAGELLVTSMDFDGTKKGFDIEVLQLLRPSVHLPIVASGGAGCAEDFIQLFQQVDVDAGLAASIFHFGEVDVKDLKATLSQAGICIRMAS